MSQNMWDERYKETAYAYGKEPNAFLKEQLQSLEAGSILFGAEGEGRNAVFASKMGWDVHAFDISKEGKKKALSLAKENNVSIMYNVGELPRLIFERDKFDVIALIYAHFPSKLKSDYHKILNNKLKKGGLIIFEAFGKDHLKYRKENPKVGGPSSLDMLFSIDELKSDFNNYTFLSIVEKEIHLSEGSFHNGKGFVVQFIAQKNRH